VKRLGRRLLAAARMGLPEIRWRARTQANNALARARSALSAPRWRRDHLLRALDPSAVPTPLVEALHGQRWVDAHALLSAFICNEPQRFLIAPSIKATLVSDILREFPDAAPEAAAEAARILDGKYDLLGYRSLRFSQSGCELDWHLDPVHQRRMPTAFWSSIDFLDPANGDHKIVWELNRHQHWIALARAYWLTGDVRCRSRFIEELQSWLASNPPLRGGNWASMLELALRALSWTWALNAFAATDVDADEPWTIDLLVSLDRQLDHVEHNLSCYFSPNTHLLGEALALYVTGLALPFLQASHRRADLGRRILVDEIQRQIAPDGVHRERSSHYHRYTLDFYTIALAIAEIAGDDSAAPLRAAVERMAAAAAALSDVRGGLARFGDDDGGFALPVGVRPPDDIRASLATADILLDRGFAGAPEHARWLLAHPLFQTRIRRPAAARSAVPSAALRGMGIFVSRSRGGVHVVMHAGPHGYLNGGHAHADALSVTATVRGTALLVDPGTGSYTANSDLRNRFRSTKSHNTIALDGLDQSIPDGPFHWRKRAAAMLFEWRSADGFDYFDALHDGYNPHEHRRRVMSIHDDLLIVMDHIKVGAREPGTQKQHLIASHWHVDPRWSVRIAPHRATLSLNDDSVEVVAPTGMLEHFIADAALGIGWHSPVYGRVEPGSTLRVLQTTPASTWSVTIFGLRSDNSISTVHVLPSPCARPGCGLRIVRQRSTDYALVMEPPLHGEPKLATFDEISTDARACYCRVSRGRITRASLVGGSLVTVEPPSRTAVPDRSLEATS
jgi:hypothetical protein